MTTLDGRPRSALLVVDVQNGTVDGAHERGAVVANVATLVARARREGVPVVWVRQTDDENFVAGSEQWQIVPELAPGDAEPPVEKSDARGARADGRDGADRERRLRGAVLTAGPLTAPFRHHVSDHRKGVCDRLGSGNALVGTGSRLSPPPRVGAFAPVLAVTHRAGSAGSRQAG